MNTEKKTPLQIAIRILIVIGLLILLLLITFGIIKLVPKALNSISSLHSTLFATHPSSEKIIVSSEPAVYKSGSDGIMTWTQIGGEASGYYTFQYDCADGSITIENVTCNQVFVLKDATSTDVAMTLPIHVINSGSKDATTTLTVSHRKVDSSDIFQEGSTTISVSANNESSTNSVTVVPNTTVVKSEQTTSTNNPTPIVQGPADLVVNITSLGTVTTANGLVSVRFNVTNVGGSSSGVWRFRANLPTISPATQIYDSAFQSSIPAGKTSTFTLSFLGAQSGTNPVIIYVDSGSNVAESNESNNQTVANITVSGNNGGGGIVSGPADLVFRSVEVGVVDKSTGFFSPQNSFTRGQTLGLRLTIANQGSQSTGTWSFRTVVNDSNDGILSGSLVSMQGGEIRTYILGLDFFNDFSSGDKDIEITLDNNHQVSESNEGNNTAFVTSFAR